MSQIDELRQIIIGDNSAALSELKARIENLDVRARDVAEVLAPAIERGIRKDEGLVNALTEPVSVGLKKAIRHEPGEYAEILYPAIAPSIRLAISQAISSLLVTINQTIASATTLTGIRTRIESARTGVPYAELVLRRSLVYCVEHVYVIHRDSGLLVGECAADGSNVLDSDAISAMFSAIQSFVQDSFSADGENRLTDFKVGAYTIWVVHAPKAMLACVIFGNAPESLKAQLYDTLDGISTTYMQVLSEFDGDNSAFVGVEERLKPLLQSRLKRGADRPAKIRVASALFLPTLVVLAAFLLAGWFDNSSKLAVVAYYFDKSPGLLQTATYWKDGKIVIEGLHDPDAELPLAVLGAYDIHASLLSIRTTPFRSLQPEMEIQRFNRELVPPKTTVFKRVGDQLMLAGNAPVSWLLKNQARLHQLAIDRRLNLSELRLSRASLRDYLNVNLIDVEEDLRQQIAEQLFTKPWHQLDLNQLQPDSLQQWARDVIKVESD